MPEPDEDAGCEYIAAADIQAVIRGLSTKKSGPVLGKSNRDRISEQLALGGIRWDMHRRRNSKFGIRRMGRTIQRMAIF